MDLITRILEGLASRGRIAFYRVLGMKIRGHVSLRAIEVRQRPQCITLENGAALDRGVILLATSDAARIGIGASVYINRHTMIDAHESVEIGAGCMIGPFCYLTDHDHSVGPGIAPAYCARAGRAGADNTTKITRSFVRIEDLTSGQQPISSTPRKSGKFHLLSIGSKSVSTEKECALSACRDAWLTLIAASRALMKSNTCAWNSQEFKEWPATTSVRCRKTLDPSAAESKLAD